MAKTGAGILMYKFENRELRIFLVHLGGPYYKNKDFGYWMIPKGEVENGEDDFTCALRELEEEIGLKLSNDSKQYIDLGEIKQKGGKLVHIFAIQYNFGGFFMKQSFIEIEYPKGSGKKIKFPEVDELGFFSLDEARKKILKSQEEFIDRLVGRLN